MKYYIFCFICIVFTSITFSQENKDVPNFRVSISDLKMTSYAKDSTANVLVLYEQGNSYVNNQEYDLRTTEKHKIKIFNKEGFDQANITIYLYKKDVNRFEEVKNIIANTYNLEDGKVISTKLDENNIYKEEYNKNYTLVKFTLPNIKEGSVFTYSFTKTSPFMFKYKGWDFQGEIPKLYSEYCASIPAYWKYNTKLVGSKKLSIHESKTKKACLIISTGNKINCLDSRYAMENIPAFINEKHMTSKSNYLARIDYELKTYTSRHGTKYDYSKTWKTVDKDLKTDDNIGRQLLKSTKKEELLNSDIINETDALKKAQGIYKYVQENYTWNGDNKIFKDVSVKNLIKNKSGNVSSINILLHNLLKASKIKVKPILLSTRNNGFATKRYPVISDFNYLIVQATINKKNYLLDATDNYLSFGDIPFRCLNQYGRLLDFKNGSNWIDIKPNNSSHTSYNVELKINETSKLTGSVKTERTGYHALKSKKSYFSNKEVYIEKLENNSPYIEIINHESSSNKTDTDFTESYQIEYTHDEKGETLYLNPFFYKFFSENPFKLQERNYPIDFGYRSTYNYTLKLNIGTNYSIIELPEDILLNLPNDTGLLSFSTKVIDNAINVFIKISFNETIYEPEHYSALKEFMSKVVDIQTNSIIVLKKNK